MSSSGKVCQRRKEKRLSPSTLPNVYFASQCISIRSDPDLLKSLTILFPPVSSNRVTASCARHLPTRRSDHQTQYTSAMDFLRELTPVRLAKRQPEAASPPPYEAHLPTADEASESKQSSPSRAIRRYLPLNPALDAARPGTLRMRIHPANQLVPKHQIRPGQPTWVAFLHIETPDLPRLMREGFHWSSANVDRGGSYMSATYQNFPERVVEAFPGHVNMFCVRMFSLSSRCVGGGGKEDDLSWEGDLAIWGKELADVAPFRLPDVQPENIWSAQAFDSRSRFVYSYRWDEPETSYNCIYDDLPLAGWWPWPKPEVSASIKEEIRSN